MCCEKIKKLTGVNRPRFAYKVVQELDKEVCDYLTTIFGFPLKMGEWAAAPKAEPGLDFSKWVPNLVRELKLYPDNVRYEGIGRIRVEFSRDNNGRFSSFRHETDALSCGLFCNFRFNRARLDPLPQVVVKVELGGLIYSARFPVGLCGYETVLSTRIKLDSLVGFVFD